jgi:hypothetical protein
MKSWVLWCPVRLIRLIFSASHLLFLARTQDEGALGRSSRTRTPPGATRAVEIRARSAGQDTSYAVSAYPVRSGPKRPAKRCFPSIRGRRTPSVDIENEGMAAQESPFPVNRDIL